MILISIGRKYQENPIDRQFRQLITEAFDGLQVICIAFWEFFNGFRLMILISISRKYQENPIDSFKKNPIDTITDNFKSPKIHDRQFQIFHPCKDYDVQG